jgi:hypothetical protein
MAKYEVLELSFINNTLVQPGEIIEFDGIAASNLKPVGKSRKAAAEVPDDTPTE